jgi:hypothetical protein
VACGVGHQLNTLLFERFLGLEEVAIRPLYIEFLVPAHVEEMADKEILSLIEKGYEWQEDVVPIFAARPEMTFLVDLEVYVDEIGNGFTEKCFLLVQAQAKSTQLKSKLTTSKQKCTFNSKTNEIDPRELREIEASRLRVWRECWCR